MRHLSQSGITFPPAAPQVRGGTMLLLWLMLAPSSALATPLKVSPGSKSQVVIMCPDCRVPMICAKAGDYGVSFSADLQDPHRGIVRMATRITGEDSALVENAEVTVPLSSPKEGHARQPIKMKHIGDGKYAATTGPLMHGGWKAEIVFTRCERIMCGWALPWFH